MSRRIYRFENRNGSNEEDLYMPKETEPVLELFSIDEHNEEREWQKLRESEREYGIKTYDNFSDILKEIEVECTE